MPRFLLPALLVFAAVWSVSPGDPLGFGAWVTRVTGYDVLAARAATAFGHRISAGVACSSPTRTAGP
jgi:alkane 1-monooxygenase